MFRLREFRSLHDSRRSKGPLRTVPATWVALFIPAVHIVVHRCPLRVAMKMASPRLRSLSLAKRSFSSHLRPHLRHASPVRPGLRDRYCRSRIEPSHRSIRTELHPRDRCARWLDRPASCRLSRSSSRRYGPRWRRRKPHPTGRNPSESAPLMARPDRCRSTKDTP